MSLGERRWLICRARGESFGVELKWVRHIDFHPRVLGLPTAEPPLVGLMHWSGSQVPALSLDQLLGGAGSSEYRAALMLEVEGRRLGLLVEEVGETLSVPGESVFGLDQALEGREGLVTEAARAAGGDLIFGLNAVQISAASGL